MSTLAAAVPPTGTGPERAVFVDPETGTTHGI